DSGHGCANLVSPLPDAVTEVRDRHNLGPRVGTGVGRAIGDGLPERVLDRELHRGGVVVDRRAAVAREEAFLANSVGRVLRAGATCELHLAHEASVDDGALGTDHRLRTDSYKDIKSRVRGED